MYEQIPVFDTSLALTPLQDRTQRVKDARSEAQREIDVYRKNKELEYKQAQEQVLIEG